MTNHEYLGAYTDVSAYHGWILDTRQNYDPCVNVASECNSIIETSPGVLTPAKNNNNHYLNNQVNDVIIRI